MYTFLIDHLDIKLNYMIFTYQLIIKVNYSQYVLQMTHISFFLHELSTYGNKIMKYCSINCNYHYKFTRFFLI